MSTALTIATVAVKATGRSRWMRLQRNAFRAGSHGSACSSPAAGTVTLIEKCSGAVGIEAVATEHRWVVHISGGSVGRGDLTPDREAVGHLGSPFGRAEQMPSRPEVCGDAAEGGQEPLRDGPPTIDAMPLEIHTQPDPDHFCETCGGPSELVPQTITSWVGNETMAREVSPWTPRCADPWCQSRRPRHRR